MRSAWRAGALAAALTMAAVAVASIGDERIAPGVRVAGLDVGMLTQVDARALVSGRAAAFARAPVLVIEAETVWPTTNGDIGVALDVDRATALALAVGRTGSAEARMGEAFAAAVGAVDLGWPRRVHDARLDAFVEKVALHIEREPVDGDVRVTTDGVRITPAIAGRRVDRELLRSEILASRDEIALIALSVEPLAASIGDAATAEVAARAEHAYVPLRISAGSESLIVEPARLAAVMRVTRDPAQDDRLLLVADPAAIEQLVSEIAAALDGEQRDAVLVPGDERLAVIAGRDAVRVDRAAAADALARAILAGTGSLAIPAGVSSPALSTASAMRTASELRLAGSFSTYFPVNEARRANISRAAATFDGMVVGPGERFSFWDRIGEVSARTGYVYAGTIIGGVSTLAIGGGLCQVSTTLFNAVAAAGYAIDERHPHSYYIERYPIGLDAAVFAPDTDLVWTNDTGSPALIRAAATDTSVSFWIYAAPNGRTTAFSDASQWNLSWPWPGQPADPAHAPGYVVLGRDVLVTRTVTDAAGAIVHRDDFYSHYAPVWGGPAR